VKKRSCLFIFYGGRGVGDEDGVGGGGGSIDRVMAVVVVVEKPRQSDQH